MEKRYYSFMDKQTLVNKAVKLFLDMDLNVFKAMEHYESFNPEYIVLYPNKKRYYMLEFISDECLQDPYPRINILDEDINIREYCKKMHNDNRKASWSSAILSDIASGVRKFDPRELGCLDVTGMKGYGGLIYPPNLDDEAREALDYLQLKSESLPIDDDITLRLISRADTIKLSEKRLFVEFLTASF